MSTPIYLKIGLLRGRPQKNSYLLTCYRNGTCQKPQPDFGIWHTPRHATPRLHAYGPRLRARRYAQASGFGINRGHGAIAGMERWGHSCTRGPQRMPACWPGGKASWGHAMPCHAAESTYVHVLSHIYGTEAQNQ